MKSIRRNVLALFLISGAALSQQNLNTTLVGSLNVGMSGYSNIWGWTSPGGIEYAILGGVTGTSFIDISGAPIERDFVPGTNYWGAGLWREIQVWQHYAYVVTESYEDTDPSTFGVQIIDMSPLPDSVRLVRYYSSMVLGGREFRGAHSLHIQDGYLYINGGTVYGTAIFDLADPENPTYKGAYIPVENGVMSYTHDCYVRNDTLYACDILNGWVDVVDVRNKSNPVRIHRIFHPEVGAWAPHNAAVSTDGNFLLITDENSRTPGFLTIWDLRNFRNGGLDIDRYASYKSSFGGLVHNAYVKDGMAIMSYYLDGVHLVDISDPSDPVHVGNYDCDSRVGPNFAGAWGVYPFFESGKIVISDMEDGLFVFSHNGVRAGRVQGTVRDLHSGQSIPNAQLILQSSKQRLSDANGHYSMGNQPGSYIMQIKASGYYDTTVTFVAESGIIKDRDLYLRKVPTAGPPLPTVFSLKQNFPNPFNPTTSIIFDVPRSSRVRITVYNILGQKIAVAADREYAAGLGTALWDGKDQRGLDVASGVYLYRLEAIDPVSGKSVTESRRMILIR